MANAIPINSSSVPSAVQPSSVVSAPKSMEAPAPVVKIEPLVPLDVVKTSVHDVGQEAQLIKTANAELNQQMLEQLKEAASRLQQAVETTPTRLKFSVDEVGSRFVISVTDDATGELIRQVPGEAIIRIAHSIEMMKGVLFDKSL